MRGILLKFLFVVSAFVVNSALAKEHGIILKPGEYEIKEDSLCYYMNKPYSGLTMLSEKDLNMEGPVGSGVTVNSWKNGLKHGPQTIYYTSERLKIRSVVMFKSGIRDGPTKIWDFNGNLKLTSFYENGMLSGWVITYYDDGSMESRAHYVGNELDGPFLVWDRSGDLVRYYIYSLGKKIRILKEAKSEREE